MSIRFIRTLVAASVVLSALPGCAAGGLTFPFGQTTLKPDTRREEFKSKLAHLEFRSITQETQKQLERVAPGLLGNTGAGVSRESGTTAVPAVGADAAGKTFAPVSGSGAGSGSAPTGGGGVSSYIPSIYNYGYYFSGPFGPMKLDKVVEATTSGSSAGWNEIRARIIDPVLADWAADAGLIASSATLDENGDPIQGQASYPGEIGWRLAYAAPSIREAMYFMISPAETRVVRMRWVPVTIDPAVIEVDAKGAIDRARAGIRDASFKSLEDLKGFGFFYPKEEGYGAPAVMPMPARADVALVAPAAGGATAGSAVGGSDGAVYYQPRVQEQELHELQPGGRWYANLAVIGAYTLWELTYTLYAGEGRAAVAKGVPESTVAPAPPTDDSGPKEPTRPADYSYVDNYVYAYVDARTGDVIRLRRPRKVSVTYEEATYPTRDDQPKPY